MFRYFLGHTLPFKVQNNVTFRKQPPGLIFFKDSRKGQKKKKIASEINSLSDAAITASSKFDNNSRYEDYECDSACANHRSEKFWKKSRDIEMSEISCDEYPVWTGEEEGGKLSTNEVAKRLPISWISSRESRKFAGSCASLRRRGGAVCSKKAHLAFRWNRMDPALAVSYSDWGSCVNLRIARCVGALKRSCCAPPSRDSNTRNTKRNFMIKASLGIASVAGKCVCTTSF